MLYQPDESLLVVLARHLLHEVCLPSLHYENLPVSERLFCQGMLPKVNHGPHDQTLFALFQYVVHQREEALLLEPVDSFGRKCSQNELLPFLPAPEVLSILECNESLHLEIMLAHVQRYHIVLFQDVLLESVQVFALEEHLGNFLFDSVGVPNLYNFLGDVEVPLCFVLRDSLVGLTHASLLEALKGRLQCPCLEKGR